MTLSNKARVVVGCIFFPIITKTILAGFINIYFSVLFVSIEIMLLMYTKYRDKILGKIGKSCGWPIWIIWLFSIISCTVLAAQINIFFGITIVLFVILLYAVMDEVKDELKEWVDDD